MSEQEEIPKKKSKKIPKEHLHDDGAVDVMYRNMALVLTYRRLVFLGLMSLAMLLVSAFAFVMVKGRTPPPQYIPVTQDGRILPLLPLSEPNMGDGEVMEFAMKTLNAVNNYDYLSWERQLQEAQGYFTPTSWRGFVDSFMATQFINTVVARKMIVQGQASGAATVVSEGLSNGVYVWRIDIPVDIRYIPHAEGASPLGMTGTAEIYVERVGPSLSPQGIAIRAYIFRPDN